VGVDAEEEALMLMILFDGKETEGETVRAARRADD